MRRCECDVEARSVFSKVELNYAMGRCGVWLPLRYVKALAQCVRSRDRSVVFTFGRRRA
jgi:hypothetical protein